MRIYKDSDPWQDIVDEAWELAKSQTGYDSEESCEIVLTCRSQGNLTISDAIADLTNRSDGQAVLDWTALFMLHRLPLEARQTLINNICQEPVISCKVYLWNENLTEDEDKLLWSSISGSMTYMADQIRSGNILRAKES